MKTTKAQELLATALERLETLKAVCDYTGLNKSSLCRIGNGETKKPHDDTLGKLIKAAYGE